MEPSVAPATASSPPPQPVTGTSRRFCLIVVMCWVLPATALYAVDAFTAPTPESENWLYSIPGWASTLAQLLAAGEWIVWLVLPVLLLALGLDHIRGAGPAGWTWRAAWIAIVGAGTGVEVATVPLDMMITTAMPNWTAFAEAVGFAVVGVLMTLVLLGATRSNSGLKRSAPPES